MINVKKVLLVDDDADFSGLLRLSMEAEFAVFTASDGREGIKMAASLKPDLILMDVMMPNISGIELARMLNAEEETRKIPLIVLTASHADNGVPELFRQESNVKRFLSKMTSMENIVKAAKEILSGR